MFKVFKVFIMVWNKVYQTDYCVNTLMVSGNTTINNQGSFYGYCGGGSVGLKIASSRRGEQRLKLLCFAQISKSFPCKKAGLQALWAVLLIL